MIIIGHDEVEFKPFYWIKSVDDIAKTPPNSAVIFSKNNQNYQELIKHCKKNSVLFANEVKNQNDALVCLANGVSFLVTSDKKLAKKLQDIVNNYLLDAKILLRLEDEEEMSSVAKLGIDGVIFKNGEIIYG